MSESRYADLGDDDAVAEAAVREERRVPFPPTPWLIALSALTLISLVEVRWWDGALEMSVRATMVTAALVVAVWLPSVLALVLKYGGTISAAGIGVGIEAIRRVGAVRPARLTAAGRGDFAEAPASGLRELASQFETLRRRMPSSFQRSTAMETILAEARLLAGEAADELPDRLSRFASDEDGDRIVTLALLQGLPAPLPTGSADVLASALTSPRGSFEEYHALRTLRDRFSDLESRGRSGAVDAVRRLLDDGRYPSGSDRLALARQVVRGADER